MINAKQLIVYFPNPNSNTIQIIMVARGSQGRGPAAGAASFCLTLLV